MEETKLLLFKDDMIVYIENLKEFTHILALTRFSRVLHIHKYIQIICIYIHHKQIFKI